MAKTRLVGLESLFHWVCYNPGNIFRSLTEWSKPNKLLGRGMYFAINTQTRLIAKYFATIVSYDISSSTLHQRCSQNISKIDKFLQNGNVDCRMISRNTDSVDVTVDQQTHMMFRRYSTASDIVKVHNNRVFTHVFKIQSLSSSITCFSLALLS